MHARTRGHTQHTDTLPSPTVTFVIHFKGAACVLLSLCACDTEIVSLYLLPRVVHINIFVDVNSRDLECNFVLEVTIQRKYRDIYHSVFQSYFKLLRLLHSFDLLSLFCDLAFFFF